MDRNEHSKIEALGLGMVFGWDAVTVSALSGALDAAREAAIYAFLDAQPELNRVPLPPEERVNPFRGKH